MGFWIFKSAREKALTQLRKDVHAMYELAMDEYEDSEIEDLTRQVHDLKRLFTAEEPVQAAPVGGMPKEMIDGVMQLVPEGWRNIARGPIEKFLSDPKNLEKVRERITPLLGQQPKPQQNVPPEYSGQSYVPPQ